MLQFLVLKTVTKKEIYKYIIPDVQYCSIFSEFWTLDGIFENPIFKMLK